jgi:hypothetical protein
MRPCSKIVQCASLRLAHGRSSESERSRATWTVERASHQFDPELQTSTLRAHFDLPGDLTGYN